MVLFSVLELLVLWSAWSAAQTSHQQLAVLVAMSDCGGKMPSFSNQSAFAVVLVAKVRASTARTVPAPAAADTVAATVIWIVFGNRCGDRFGNCCTVYDDGSGFRCGYGDGGVSGVVAIVAAFLSLVGVVNFPCSVLACRRRLWC